MNIRDLIAPELIALAGMIFGTIGFLVGIAQIVCEHKTSPQLQRALTALLSLLCAWSAADCWPSFADSEAHPVNLHAVAFCIGLAGTWGYRRLRGLMSVRLPPPMKGTS